MMKVIKSKMDNHKNINTSRISNPDFVLYNIIITNTQSNLNILILISLCIWV